MIHIRYKEGLIWAIKNIRLRKNTTLKWMTMTG